MTGAFVSLDGVPASSVSLLIPWSGMAYATLQFDAPLSLPTGPATLGIGALELLGRVDPVRSGDYALATTVTFVGGGAGWRTVVRPRAFHNDAGVKRSTVLAATAAEVGEVIVITAGLDSAVGVDFERSACPATRVIEQLFPTSQWYVDEAGVTQIGPRQTRDVTGKIELLGVDVSSSRCTIAGDDPRDFMPGCVFSDSRFPAGFSIHDVEINVTGGTARATAWSGTGRSDRLRGLLRTVVTESVPRLAHAGPFRYRVISMAGDRANLQAVSNAPGLPDALPITLAPGQAGSWAQLQPGCVVLVQFIELDAGQPIVTHYAPTSDVAFLPIVARLDASSDVQIGTSATAVHVGSREPIATALATASRRPVCYGDIITGPASIGAPYTMAPGLGAVDLSRIKT